MFFLYIILKIHMDKWNVHICIYNWPSMVCWEHLKGLLPNLLLKLNFWHIEKATDQRKHEIIGKQKDKQLKGTFSRIKNLFINLGFSVILWQFWHLLDANPYFKCYSVIFQVSLSNSICIAFLGFCITISH